MSQNISGKNKELDYMLWRGVETIPPIGNPILPEGYKPHPVTNSTFLHITPCAGGMPYSEACNKVNFIYFYIMLGGVKRDERGIAFSNILI